MKDKLATALQEQGLEGATALLESEILTNDRRWLLWYLLSITIFGGFYALHDCKNVPNNYVKVVSYADSLQNFVDTSMTVKGLK